MAGGHDNDYFRLMLNRFFLYSLAYLNDFYSSAMHINISI